MSFTASVRETFGDNYTLNAGTPGSMGTIPTGSIIRHFRGVGASGGAALEDYSGVIIAADLDTYENCTGAKETLVGFWIRFKDFGAANAVNYDIFCRARTAGDADQIWVAMRSDGTLVVWDLGVGDRGTITGLSVETWYYVKLSVSQPTVDVGGGVNEYHVSLYNSVGSLLGNITRSGAFILQPVAKIGICNKLFGGTATYYRARVAWYDFLTGDGAGYPNDAGYPQSYRPTPGPFIWIMTQGGNAMSNGQNSGTPSEAFDLSATTFAYETKDGIFEGDTLVVDNTHGTWDVGANCLNANKANGFHLWFVGESKWYKDISGVGSGGTTTWINHSGDIWKTTDGGATDLGTINLAIHLYVNGEAVTNHPVGANIAAVVVALATPDSMWCDGTTIYYNAGVGVNPNTATNLTILRSRDRIYPGTATHGAPALLYDFCRGTFTLNNAKIWYTGMTSPQDNNVIGENDAVRVLNATSLDFTYNDPNFRHNGKHHFTYGSDTTGVTGVTIRGRRIITGKGHPYCGAGQWTSTAFNVNPAGEWRHYADIDGWTSTDTSGNPLIVAHGTNVNTWTLLSFKNVYAPGNGVSLQNTSTVLATFYDCTFKTLAQPQGGNLQYYRGSVLGGISGSGGITLWYTLWIPVETLTSGNTNVQIAGTNAFYECDIDVSGCTAGDANASLLYRTGVSSLTFVGCAWRDGGKDIALVGNAATGEIASDYNLIEKVVGSRWMENYNAADKTGTQWIALGFDTHSTFAADIKVTASPNYRLKSDSAGRGLVPLATYPQLKGSLSANSVAAGFSGNIDAGAFTYLDGRRYAGRSDDIND